MLETAEEARKRVETLVAKNHALYAEAAQLFDQLAYLAQQARQAGKAEAATEPKATPPDFEAWWADVGQYCRAGGGEYEKTFAYRAWEARNAEVAALRARVAELEAAAGAAP